VSLVGDGGMAGLGRSHTDGYVVQAVELSRSSADEAQLIWITPQIAGGFLGGTLWCGVNGTTHLSYGDGGDESVGQG
jgi:hypothetical protein